MQKVKKRQAKRKAAPKKEVFMNEAFVGWLRKQYKIPEEELVLPTVPVFSVKSTAAANRHLSVIIPVSFGVWESVCLISCYEELMPVMHRYAESGGASMFEDAPLAWLNKQIQPFLAARGYQSSRYWRKWGFTCLAEDPLQIRKDILRKDTVQVKNAGGLLPYRNRTTYSIEEGLREGRIFFATVERRTILSAAVTHAGSKTPGIIEIGVETAPEARGRGLAAANTAALALALLERGTAVVYQCNRYNTASLKNRIKGRFSNQR